MAAEFPIFDPPCIEILGIPRTYALFIASFESPGRPICESDGSPNPAIVTSSLMNIGRAFDKPICARKSPFLHAIRPVMTPSLDDATVWLRI